MPSDRFYRLPEEKKVLIRDAAVKEFIRVPFDKASINQIILNADISRGSFYTYFEDKRDLLRYIFRDTEIRVRNFCKESLERCAGDYWKMMEELLDFFINYFSSNNLLQLSKNIMVCQDAEQFFEIYCQEKSDIEQDELIEQWMYDKIDKREYQIRTMEEFKYLLEISEAMLMIGVRQYYKNPEDIETVREQFRKRLKLFKYGALVPVKNGFGEDEIYYEKKQ